MMSNILYYKILKYIPSAIRMETLNVGIVVHYPAKKYSHFFKTTNIKRVRAFDDEYNPDFFNMIMDSLSYELDYAENLIDTFNLEQDRFKDITSPCFLDRRTDYLANEFIFSKTQELHTDNKEYKEDIKNLQGIYLYYDRPKGKRISKDNVKRVISKQIKSFNLNDVKQNPISSSLFGSTKFYDFKVNNSFIKSISFDYKRANDLIKELKLILFDLGSIEYDSNISNIFLISNEKGPLQDQNITKIIEKFILELQNIFKDKSINIGVQPISELSNVLNQTI